MSSIPKLPRWSSIRINRPLYVYLGDELAEEKSFMLEQILSDNNKHIMKLTESHNQEMKVRFLFAKLYFVDPVQPQKYKRNICHPWSMKWNSSLVQS